MARLSIKTLRLQDFRCFEQLDIDFHASMTVIVAPNGAGKTAVLDGLAVAFGPFIGAFDEGVGKHFLPSDIRSVKARHTDSYEMESAPNGVKLSATGYIEDSPHHIDPELAEVWSRHLSGKKSKTTIKDAYCLREAGKRLQKAVRTQGNGAVLPLIAMYGTGRLWSLKKLTSKKSENRSRTSGYIDCMDSASSYSSFLYAFKYWCTNALIAKSTILEAARDGKAPAAEKFEFVDFIKAVKTAVDCCLQPSGWQDVDYSFSQETLVARHSDHGEMPVEFLSDGIRNMIGMVADIAFRAVKLNPQLGAKAALETPGVVMIDEVDMHLHPSWQQIVLQNLNLAFPNLQFIVTSHSPQVLSSVDSSCIRVLHTKTWDDTGEQHTQGVGVEWQTKGVSSADLLARIMGVDPVPNVQEAHDLSRYLALIQQNIHMAAEGVALYEILIAHFGEGHPAMEKCSRAIEFQALKHRVASKQPSH